MSIKNERNAKITTSAAVFGCLFFSGFAAADEIKDQNHNALYGRIAGFSAEGVIFHQNCGDAGQTFAWSDLSEARFSGDCSVAKSWRGGGDTPCDVQGGQWIEKPGLVALEVMPEVVQGDGVLPFGTATELLGRDASSVRYRDVCTGAEKTIPTGDLVLTPTSGYCSTECQ